MVKCMKDAKGKTKTQKFLKSAIKWKEDLNRWEIKDNKEDIFRNDIE